MTLPQHHPSDALLTAYAAGNLGEGLSLAVATHLQFCPSCRCRLMLAETLGGVLLDDLPPDAMSADALERILDRLDEADAAPPAPPPRRSVGADRRLPPPVRAYAERCGADWRWVMPGVSQLDLFPRDRRGGFVRLFRLEPGTVLPHHAHAGTELTITLSGAYVDETGVFKVGDLAETDGETAHRPRVESDEGCLCLVASDAPLAFSGLLPRLMRPLLGL